MSDNTYLDDLVRYKELIINELASSKEILGLLSNNPDIDPESDEAQALVANNIFDYGYIDTTVERSDAFIMVESELVKPSSSTINQWYIYVQVVCAKSYNNLDKKIFRGVQGNRRDNLVLEIDKLINGDREFGIGKLTLITVGPSSVPSTFTSSMITYDVNNFRRERLVKK